MIDRRKPSAPRERVLLPSAQFCDHAQGWIAYGMHMICPHDASDEFKKGYAERRNSVVSELLGVE